VGPLRSVKHHIAETVAVEEANGLEVARKGFAVTCVQRGDELLCGLFRDFLDLF
jgi:hypothetical protein